MESVVQACINYFAMNINDVINRPVAVLIWNVEQNDDAHVYRGAICLEGNSYIWRNQQKGWKIELTNAHLNRIEYVRENMKDIFLDADFFISLTMGNIGDELANQLLHTGINWNTEK